MATAVHDQQPTVDENRVRFETELEVRPRLVSAEPVQYVGD